MSSTTGVNQVPSVTIDIDEQLLTRLKNKKAHEKIDQVAERATSVLQGSSAVSTLPITYSVYSSALNDGPSTDKSIDRYEQSSESVYRQIEKSVEKVADCSHALVDHSCTK